MKKEFSITNPRKKIGIVFVGITIVQAILFLILHDFNQPIWNSFLYRGSTADLLAQWFQLLIGILFFIAGILLIRMGKPVIVFRIDESFLEYAKKEEEEQGLFSDGYESVLTRIPYRDVEWIEWKEKNRKKYILLKKHDGIIYTIPAKLFARDKEKIVGFIKEKIK